MKKTHQINQEAGFTLIEILIVVSIIGILFSVGTAAYSDYAKKVNDEYAKIMLEDIIGRQKAYYIHNRRYTASFQQLGFDSEQVQSEHGFFSARLARCGTEKITTCVQATARPLTELTTGTTFIRDSRGNRLPADKW